MGISDCRKEKYDEDKGFGEGSLGIGWPGQNPLSSASELLKGAFFDRKNWASERPSRISESNCSRRSLLA